MAEILPKGPIVGWETAPEIYVEEIVGINVFEDAVAVTLAVNRVEPGKSFDAKCIRVVVGRLVMPFATANELVRQLNAMASAVRLDRETSSIGGAKDDGTTH